MRGSDRWSNVRSGGWSVCLVSIPNFSKKFCRSQKKGREFIRLLYFDIKGVVGSEYDFAVEGNGGFN